MINDVEFARLVDAEVGDHYKKAKRAFSLALPNSALIEIRSIVNLICKRIFELNGIEFKPGLSLGDKIRLLQSRDVTNSSIIQSMGSLRRSGNIGAHPEECRYTDEELTSLALKSVNDCFELVVDLSFQMPGFERVKYQYNEPTIDSGDCIEKELYSGIFLGDAESIYESALVLEQRYLKCSIECQEESRNKNDLIYWESSSVSKIRDRSVKLLQMAADLDHAGALYDVGTLKINGEIRKYDEYEPYRDIHLAAALGNIDAKALLGEWYLVGHEHIEPDIEEAQRYLSEALEQEHPLALTVLGEAEIKKENYSSAESYLLKASDSGFGSAKLRLVELILNEHIDGSFDEVTALLNESYSYNPEHKEYLLNVARMKIADSEIERQEARGYWCQMRNGSPELLYHSAKYLMDYYSDPESLSFSALKIAEAYRNVEDCDLKVEILDCCREVREKLLEKMHSMENRTVKDTKNLTSGILQFDEDGIPTTEIFDNLVKIGKNYLSKEKSKGTKLSKTRRNELCLCGSGKKYKKCCLSIN